MDTSIKTTRNHLDGTQTQDNEITTARSKLFNKLGSGDKIDISPFEGSKTNSDDPQEEASNDLDTDDKLNSALNPISAIQRLKKMHTIRQQERDLTILDRKDLEPSTVSKTMEVYEQMK